MKKLSFSQRERLYDLVDNLIDDNIPSHKIATNIIINYIKIKKNIDIIKDAKESDMETLKLVYDDKKYNDLFKEAILELCKLRDNNEDITFYKMHHKQFSSLTRHDCLRNFLIDTYENTENKSDRVLVKSIVEGYFEYMKSNYPTEVLLTERTVIDHLREKYGNNYFARRPSYIVGLKRKEDKY